MMISFADGEESDGSMNQEMPKDSRHLNGWKKRADEYPHRLVLLNAISGITRLPRNRVVDSSRRLSKHKTLWVLSQSSRPRLT